MSNILLVQKNKQQQTVSQSFLDVVMENEVKARAD